MTRLRALRPCPDGHGGEHKKGAVWDEQDAGHEAMLLRAGQAAPERPVSASAGAAAGKGAPTTAEPPAGLTQALTGSEEGGTDG